MDILDLESQFKFVSHNGVCLNLDERVQLQLGLQNFLNDYFSEQELMFWGKITGINKDYYIAMGVTYEERYEFPTKKFYWASSSDFVFSEFPPLNDQHAHSETKENQND